MDYDAPADTVEPRTESCSECGFDGSLWSRIDALHSFEWILPLAELAIDTAPEDVLHARPSQEQWSIVEYLDHVSDMIDANRRLAELAVQSDGFDIGDLEEEEWSDVVPRLAVADVTARIGDAATSYHRFLEALDPATFSSAFVVGGTRHSISWSLPHVLHDVMHHIGDIHDIRTRLGDAVRGGDGTVVRVNESAGGIPKRAVSSAVVGRRGLADDRQQTRRHHGRPWQALCLYSSEVIDALAGEGHPIEPGSIGENLTISGLDWLQLRPGTTITIGDVVGRLTLPAEPCAKISGAFLERDFRRAQHSRHPGWSRWYAEVLTPGTVRPGDAVTLS